MHILISDFDWTLCPHGKPEQFTDNIVAIKEWRDAGNKMGVATGRSLKSLSSVFPGYQEYLDYIILNDGAEAYSSEAKLFSIKINRNTIRELRSIVDSFSLNGDMGIISYDNNIATEGIGNTANKIRFWFNDQDDCAYVNRVIEEYLFERVTILTYFKVKVNFDTKAYSWINPDMKYFIELVPYGVNKYSAINNIFEPEELPKIITVGDDMNDYEMISHFDGYAVRGGNPELIAHVRPQRVTDSLESLIHDLLKSPA